MKDSVLVRIRRVEKSLPVESSTVLTVRVDDARVWLAHLTCEGSGDVVSVLTLLVGGVEEVDGEGQGEKVEVEREKRVKEDAPWMVWRWL